MWDIIDFIYISSMALIIILPIYFSIKKASDIHFRTASIYAIFAPVSILVVKVVSLNLDMYINHMVIYNKYSIWKIISYIIYLAIYAVVYYIFIRKHIKVLPKFLFFVVLGIPMLWKFISSIIQTIVVAIYSNSEYLDLMQEGANALENMVFTIIWVLLSYFIVRKLIYMALVNNEKSNELESNVVEKEYIKKSRKSVSVIALFAPIVIIVDIFAEKFILMYCAYMYGTKMYYTYHYYLCTSIVYFLTLVLCVVLYLFLTKKYQCKLPVSLCFIVFGISYLKPIIDLMSSCFYDIEQAQSFGNMMIILYMVILVIVGYFITRNTLLKFIKTE